MTGFGGGSYVSGASRSGGLLSRFHVPIKPPPYQVPGACTALPEERIPFMKRFAQLCASLAVLALVQGCCHHGWGGCGPCNTGCGYGGGYGAGYAPAGGYGYPGAVAPGAYYTGTTMQAGVPTYTAVAPTYPTVATTPLNNLPTY